MDTEHRGLNYPAERVFHVKLVWTKLTADSEPDLYLAFNKSLVKSWQQEFGTEHDLLYFNEVIEADGKMSHKTRIDKKVANTACYTVKEFSTDLRKDIIKTVSNSYLV